MADAWYINAYDWDWCFIETLWCLDSENIWVWVQFCAPDPLEDKRVDYITYTDKCWCSCCLTWENELLIYATQWTVKSLTLTDDSTNQVVNVKWSEIFWSNRAKTVVRYKTWWYPSWITDWTLAVEETTQNQYSATWYDVSWLTSWTTYYFTAFAVDSNDNVIDSKSDLISIQRWWQPWANTIAYYPLDSINTVNDLSWNNYNLTGDGVYNFWTNWWVNCCYISNGSFKVNISSIWDNWWQTVSIWYYEVSTPIYDNWVIAWFWKDVQAVMNGLLRAKWRPDSKNWIVWFNWVNNSIASTAAYNTNLWQWNYYCYTYYNWAGKLYVNWVLVSSLLGSSTSRNLITISRYGDDPRSINWYISNAIFENKERTAQEISDYFNQTKWNYWIN